MSVPWIKITTNIFDDEKIKLIDSMPEHDAILVIWIKLLTLAGKCNSSGVLLISDSMPYTEEMLAAVFNRPLNIIKLAFEAFERLGMIEKHPEILLVNWEKHQNEAALSTIRENDRVRKQRQRSKQRLMLDCPGQVPDKSRKVRTLDIELDKEIEEDIKNKSAPKVALPPSKQFIKPTLEDVKEYCTERSNSVDAEKFLNYYISNGWKVGRNAMKDWKAAIRTWEKSDFKPNTANQNKVDLSKYKDW